MIAAAARNSPPLPQRTDSDKDYTAWLQQQPEAIKTAWLGQLMAEPRAAVRREIVAKYQKSRSTPSWPTIRLDRTIAEIKAAAEGIQLEKDRQRAEGATRKRAKKLADMAADPMRFLRETEQLVNQRNIDAYHQIALRLADVREALSGTDQSSLAEQHARKLKDKNPALHHLTAELRRQGFLKK